MKEKIISCFNAGSYHYNQAADIQPKVAAMVAERLKGLSIGTVLEIGCGTGLLSQKLIHLFPQSLFMLTDISPGMLMMCEKSLPSLANVEYMCMDGEAMTTTANFDLIVSSMSLHWFCQLHQSLPKIVDKLAVGGRFEFAMLGKNSLHEWRELFSRPGTVRSNFTQNCLP